MSRRSLSTVVIGALVSLALLGPAGSAGAAQAKLRTADWCGSSSLYPRTLKPGERCTFLPLPTVRFHAIWLVNGPGAGVICGGVTRTPPYGSNVPLDGYGRPTAWKCVAPDQDRGVGELNWSAQGPFGAVGGQATIVNFSRVTISFITVPGWTTITYYA